jgi:hypothetical protein
MKCQRREKGAGERKERLVDAEAIDVRQMKNAQHGKQEQQQRHDAGESDAIKNRGAHRGQRAEPSQRREADQKARDGEEDGDAVAAIVEDGAPCESGPIRAKMNIRKRETDQNVEQDDGHDRESTQDVHAIEARDNWLQFRFMCHCCTWYPFALMETLACHTARTAL